MSGSQPSFLPLFFFSSFLPHFFVSEFQVRDMRNWRTQTSFSHKFKTRGLLSLGAADCCATNDESAFPCPRGSFFFFTYHIDCNTLLS